MERIIKAIAPDMPEDRHVKQTRDVMSWYRIVFNTRTLMVPPANIIKTNMRELERFSEAVKAFENANLDSPEYRWGDEDLVLEEATGDAILEAIRKLPELSRQHESLMACDIETRRVEWEDNILLSIGFAYGPNHCLAIHNIPLHGAKHEGTTWEHDAELLDVLDEVLNQSDIEYIWHNGKFDVGRLQYLVGIDARVDHDTMLQHFACINEKQGTHGLKDLGQLYLQAPAWDDELD